jgi:hypothetical protein
MRHHKLTRVVENADARNPNRSLPSKNGEAIPKRRNIPASISNNKPIMRNMVLG